MMLVVFFIVGAGLIAAPFFLQQISALGSVVMWTCGGGVLLLCS